jgi:hypothetical protein
VTPNGKPENPVGEEKAQPNAPASSRGKPSALHRLKTKIIEYLAHFLATAIVLGLATLLVEHLFPEWKGLKDFQEKLEMAASNLNPVALLDYVFAWIEHLFVPIREGFDRFFGFIGALIDWFLSSIQHLVSQPVLELMRLALILVLSPIIIIGSMVMVAIFFVYFCAAIVLSPITLTLTIIMKGMKANPVEAILVLVVFLPLVGLMLRLITAETASDLNLREKAGLVWLGTVMALGITTFFYFFVQMTMLGAAWTIGKLIPLAPSAVGSSAILTFIYHCTADTIKDSVTGGIVNALKKGILTIFRIR